MEKTMRPVTDKYVREDCESHFLTSSHEIKYYKSVQSQEIILNGLLGNFNINGSYILNQSIVDALFSVKKYVTRTFNELIFCSSPPCFENSIQKFYVKTYTSSEFPSIMIGDLYLMEEINKSGVRYINTLCSKIASFSQKFSSMWVENMYEAFNIVDSTEITNADIKDYANSVIAIRKNYLKSLKTLCIKEFEEQNQWLYYAKIDELNSSVEGKKISTIIENRTQALGDKAQEKFTASNDIADSVIEFNGDNLKQKSNIFKIAGKYASSIMNIINNSQNKLVGIQKTDKAKEIVENQLMITKEIENSSKTSNVIKIGDFSVDNIKTIINTPINTVENIPVKEEPVERINQDLVQFYNDRNNERMAEMADITMPFDINKDKTSQQSASASVIREDKQKIVAEEVQAVNQQVIFERTTSSKNQAIDNESNLEQ